MTASFAFRRPTPAVHDLALLRLAMLAQHDTKGRAPNVAVVREVSKAGPYEEVARALRETAFGSIEYREETGSTNADAAALLDDARFGGHSIVAEYQSRGTGRKGRAWLAPAGTALLFTTILPRSLEVESIWAVPFWSAVAVRRALADFGIVTTLQWPNDVLLGERKLAGVLCQSSVSGRSARVACGVGINVKRSPADESVNPTPAFCDDVAPIERAALLRRILEQYQRTLAMLEEPKQVVTAWEEGAQLPGRRYHIMLDGQERHFEATAQRLMAGGALHVVRLDGGHELVSLADARVLR